MYQCFTPFYGWVIIPCIDTAHYIYPFNSWWIFGLFLVFGYYEESTRNIHEQVFMWIHIYNSLRHIPRSRTAESHNNPMFNFLRNCQTASQSNCTLLHSHQLCMRIPISPSPWTTVISLSLSLFFFIKTILARMKYCFFLALACISLMTVDIE